MGNASLKERARLLEEHRNHHAKLEELASENQELKREIAELKKRNDRFQALIDSPRREEELKILLEKVTTERQIQSLKDLSELKSTVAEMLNHLKDNPELVEVDIKRELDLLRNKLNTRKEMVDVTNTSLEAFEPFYMKAFIMKRPGPEIPEVRYRRQPPEYTLQALLHSSNHFKVTRNEVTIVKSGLYLITAYMIQINKTEGSIGISVASGIRILAQDNSQIFLDGLFEKGSTKELCIVERLKANEVIRVLSHNDSVDIDVSITLLQLI